MKEINFDVGEPDFHTPDSVKRAAIRAIEENWTKYTPQPGFADLRAAVAAKFRRDNGFDADPEHIVVSCGAKHSLYNLFQVLLEPGDEVILFQPYWFAYPEQVALAHGRPVFAPLREEQGYQPDLASLRKVLSTRTRAIVLNSPCNPTGAVFKRETLSLLADLACERDLLLISDEVYETILFDGARHVSVASLGPEVAARTATINGVSKVHAMTGWRIGFAALPPELARKATRLQSLSTSGPCAIAQRAALAALTGDQGHAALMAAEYRRRRDAVVERVNGIPGLSCRPPDGAFYAFVNISALIGSRVAGVRIAGSQDFADTVQRSAAVRFQAGHRFGSDAHVRISFATSLEILHEGLERIGSLLSRGAA